MNNLYSAIYNALIYAGLIAFLIGFFTSKQISIGSYIAGYSVFILALLMILIIMFSNENLNLSTISGIFTIINNSGPFLLLLGIIGFMLYLLIYYYTNIINGHVSNGYYTFNNIILLLLFIQFYIIQGEINSSKFDNAGKLPKITNYILYLLSVICVMVTIIINIILKYYSTDGFSLYNL